MIPTSPSLSAHLSMLERVYGEPHTALTLRADLRELCRLQHEASTRREPVVFDLDRYRKLAHGVHDDTDPEAA